MNNTTSSMVFTPRTRRSPFFESSHAAGAQSYTLYNNMLIARGFVSDEEDYHHLKRAVQLWDVGCERQVEIAGPDAAKLVQMTTPRDLSLMKEGQCFYIPTVDQDGFMTNDPVLLRVGPERYWLSTSDSELLLYFKGLAAGSGLNASVREPAISPLAIQGPHAGELVRRFWGDAAADIRFFHHIRVDVDGIPMVLARSGYSLQGGFELYYEGEDRGNVLWDQLMEVGQDLDIRAGIPNEAERIEGGLLDFRADMTQEMTPLEAGLGRFCHLDRDTGCLGLQALRAKKYPTRQLRPIQIGGERVPAMEEFWTISNSDGLPVGRITSAAWSYDYQCNVAIGLIDQDFWDMGTELMVNAPDGPRSAVIKAEYWARD